LPPCRVTWNLDKGCTLCRVSFHFYMLMYSMIHLLVQEPWILETIFWIENYKFWKLQIITLHKIICSILWDNFAKTHWKDAILIFWRKVHGQVLWRVSRKIYASGRQMSSVMRKKRLAKHKKKDSHTNGSPVCRFFEFIKKTDWGAGLWVFS